MRVARPHGPLVLLLVLPLLALGTGPCPGDEDDVVVVRPAFGQLSLAGSIDVEVALAPGSLLETAQLWVDGVHLEGLAKTPTPQGFAATLPPLPAGPHNLAVGVVFAGDGMRWVLSRFSLVELDRPESCDVLNAAECVLPFPSSRFLVPDASTTTGLRVAFAADSLPLVSAVGRGTVHLDPTPYNGNDGFSPTAQILMHFPGGVDPERSGASRLLPETRTFSPTRSLLPDSPTLLLDWETGEPVAHFIENDARAADSDPSRVITFLRPGRSLTPGRRYVVAVRGLRDAAGALVRPEPVFRAIRDGLPSDIPALEARRSALEPVLERLVELGVPRDDLILAFDFTVSSDVSLTGEMLAMRDETFAWLDEQIDQGIQTFTIDSVETPNPDCEDPAESTWRLVEGTFQVPLYLTGDPFERAPRAFRLRTDATGAPVSEDLVDVPYGLAVPCAVFDEDGAAFPLPGVVLGHGLFGSGRGFVRDVAGADELADFAFVTAGTNWSGLSRPDITAPEGGGIEDTFVVRLFSDLDRFPALPDRLRQGQLHVLVLARMLARGAFNLDPLLQIDGVGVIDPEAPPRYFGASLGGIMGIMFAALSPDVVRHNVDVPGMNFSLLLQRATPFLQFEPLLGGLNADRLVQTLTVGILHELWVRGESAGYATHVLRDPLPGTPPKRVLMTVALYDQQVSNLAAQIAGATLGLPSLRGSASPERPLLPDLEGPLDSAYVVYDTGAFDPEDPEDAPFIPPLENRQAVPNPCDPHGQRAFTPASVSQLRAFFAPGGQIENFCTDDGLCNASTPDEIPFGADEPCDPQA